MVGEDNSRYLLINLAVVEVTGCLAGLQGSKKPHKEGWEATHGVLTHRVNLAYCLTHVLTCFKCVEMAARVIPQNHRDRETRIIGSA